MTYYGHGYPQQYTTTHTNQRHTLCKQDWPVHQWLLSIDHKVDTANMLASINIRLESIFWPLDESKSNIHSTFSSVLVSANSWEKYLAL